MKKIVPINWTDKVGLNIKNAVNSIIDHFEKIDKDFGKKLDKSNNDASNYISTKYNPDRYV